MEGQALLRASSKQQELLLPLTQQLPELDKVDVDQCPTVYEDGKYSIEFSCEELISEQVQRIESYVNGRNLGYLDYGVGAEPVKGMVCFKDLMASGKAHSTKYYSQPFLLQCDLVVLTFVIHMHDGTIYELSTGGLLCVSRNTRDVENIGHMINKLTEFDKSAISGGLFAKQLSPLQSLHEAWTHNIFSSLENYIKLLGEVIQCYRSNYPYFRTMGKHTIQKEQTLQSPFKVKAVTLNSFQWLMQNSEQMTEINSSKGVRYRGKHYVPLQINAENNIKSSDVYENQVVVSFISMVLHESRQIYTRYTEAVENERSNLQKSGGTNQSAAAAAPTSAGIGASASASASTSTSGAGGLANAAESAAATADNPSPSVLNTSVVNTGVVNTGVSNTGVVNTGVVNTGVAAPSVSNTAASAGVVGSGTASVAAPTADGTGDAADSATEAAPVESGAVVQEGSEAQAQNANAGAVETPAANAEGASAEVAKAEGAGADPAEASSSDAGVLNTGVVNTSVANTGGSDVTDTVGSSTEAKDGSTPAAKPQPTPNQSIQGALSAGYQTPILAVRTFQVAYCKGMLENLKQAIDQLSALLRQYLLMFEIKASPLLGMPRKTKTFQEIKPYSQVFVMLLKWFKHGEVELKQERLTLQAKTLDKVFEYYCLVELLTLFTRKGYSPALGDQSAYNYPYIVNNPTYKSGDNDIANTYVLRKEDVTVTLYYQPLISSTEFQNNLALYRTTNPHHTTDFYVPDFVVKFNKGGDEIYAIFDAKFSSRQNILDYYFKDVVHKYSIEIAVNQPYPVPRLVWIFQGRMMTSKEDALWRYHNSPLAMLLKQHTSFGVIALNALTEGITDDLWTEMQSCIPWI